MQDAGLATLLFDLLTAEEEAVDLRTREHRFNIGLLAERVEGAVAWLHDQPETQELRIGCFGASTGAAAALIAAARLPGSVQAVVSRGGRPDLAGEYLPEVKAPTLLIVGGNDHPVIEMNEDALQRLVQATEKRLILVPRATHLFEEPDTLEEAARLAGEWFTRHLSQSPFQ